jgi:hypothetical protein
LAGFTALALLVLVGCASDGARPASTPTTPARPAASVEPARTATAVATTATQVFAAFGSGGAPTAGVVAHRPGRCWTSSITVSARNAFRCFAGNEILDPCFAAPAPAGRNTVACYADPWSRAVVLRLTAALPASGAPLKISQPWAIELAGGDRCVVTTGTTSLLRGVAMRYQCGDATAGLVTSSGPRLSALERTSSGEVRTVRVVTAWLA